jgi:type I restriction enzyme M protein
MDQQQNGRIVSFIWKIADDVLRDVFVRGKYRDVIRRLDAVLEPTKAEVLKTREWLDAENMPNPDPILRSAARHPFYNVSNFTLRSLLASRVTGH